MTSLNKVIIFGGTHGNEWTGIVLVKKFAQLLKEEFPELDLHFIEANPEAYRLNRRYKDEDLNRAFQFLSEQKENSYEHQRAKELKKLIDSAPCFVIDLHTTTANMGNTVIMAHDRPVNFHVASHLCQTLDDTRVILSPDPTRKYLASQSEFGLMIEVGPISNSLIDAQVLDATLKLLREVLKSIKMLPKLSLSPIDVYEEIENIHYPQDENEELTAYIHKDFQGKDFVAVNGEYTAFKSFDGKNITLKTNEELYPIFINEAAYYGTGLAYILCRKRSLNG
jgi:aspartoacylase